MRSLVKVLIVLLVVTVFMAGSVPAWAKPVKGLFLYWRGQTDCDRSFKDTLKEMGYEVEAVEFDAQQDIAKLQQFLDSVDETQYDFVYVLTTNAALEASKKIKKTPIFFAMVSTPVKAGLIKSWESSGNNVTGVTHAIPLIDEVNFIGKLGKFNKIGMIYDPTQNNSVIAFEELGKVFKEKNITFIGYPVSKVEDIDSVVNKVIEEKPDLVYFPSDSFVLYNGGKIVKLLTEKKIPTFGTLERLVTEHKAMIGVIAKYTVVGRELAINANEVLGGKAPSEVASRRLTPEQQTIVINAKTAEAVGFEIPYEIIEMAEIKE